MSMYVSQLATKALGLAPSGETYHGEATRCTMCGMPIHDGDLGTRFKPGESFTDYPSLGRTGYICGHCKTTTDQRVMRSLQRCVITEHGCYPMGKDDHRAWFLLNVPEPPFAVVVNQSNNTAAALHMHWKTPVTVDKRLIQVNITGTVLQLRYDVFMEAMGWCETIMQAVNAMVPAAKRREKRRHPFKSLNRDVLGSGALNNGTLLDEVSKLGAEYAPTIAKLRNLKAGELWALATMMKEKTPTPLKPELITSVK